MKNIKFNLGKFRLGNGLEFSVFLEDLNVFLVFLLGGLYRDLILVLGNLICFGF